MKPESLFRRQVRKWIDLELTHAVVFSIQQMALNGDPDLILCLNGYFVALELKAEGGKVRPLQEHRLQQIQFVGKGEAMDVSPTNWSFVQKRLLEIDKGETAYGEKR